MQAPMQNTPGYQRAHPQSRRDIIKAHDLNGAGVSVGQFLLLVIGVAFFSGAGFIAEETTPFIADYRILWIAATLLLSVLTFYAYHRTILYKADGALRDQRRYIAEGQVPRLTDEQRNALLIDAHTAVDIGSWTETLEYWPVQRRLTDAGARAFASLFFEIAEPSVYLKQLDSDWGVLSEESFEEIQAMLLKGEMHSCRFAMIGRGKMKSSPKSMFRRLAELTSTSPAYVESCLHSQERRPPQLLWAFDLWRCVVLARNGYMGGLISEKVAWRTILLAASRTFAIFPTRQTYHCNLLLGHAFWSDDYKHVQARAAMIEAFEASDFPIRELPWPTEPVGLTLPEYYLDGLAKVELAESEPG